MSEETTNIETPEAEGQPDAPAQSGENEDNGIRPEESMVEFLERRHKEQNAKQAQSVAEDSAPVKEEPKPADELAQDAANKEEGEDEENYLKLTDEERQLLNRKHKPKGARANAEHKARLNAEAQLAEKDNQIAQYRELVQKLTQSASKHDDQTGNDDDEYLKKLGIDPESFVDDEAKKFLIKQQKEMDQLKELVKKQSAASQFQQVQSALRQGYDALSDGERALIDGAYDHVLLMEVNQLRNNGLSADDAQRQAKANMFQFMSANYAAGNDAYQALYKQAKATNYTPPAKDAPKKQTTSDDLQKLRQVAGAPQHALASAGGQKPNAQGAMTPEYIETMDRIKRLSQ